MTTSVKPLLNIMSIRLGMYEDGTIQPAEIVKNAVATLVARLRDLESTEEIDVSILSENPILVQYIRKSTGEVLAEIDATKNNIT
jgi:hypothetical protein